MQQAKVIQFRAAGAAQEARVTKRMVAKHFGVSMRTVERYMRIGLPYEKPFPGGSVRFVLSEVEQWFHEHHRTL